MKRLLIITLMLCAFVNTVMAQRITHNFQNVSMSDALKYIQHQTNKHKTVALIMDKATSANYKIAKQITVFFYALPASGRPFSRLAPHAL